MEQIRISQAQRGVRIEIATLIWMTIEMAVSIGAGVASGSVLLVAFGLDSLIELIGGAVLLWRLRIEVNDGDAERLEQAEQKASWLVAGCLALLCLYVVVSAIYGLASRMRPETSVAGIIVAAAALVVMPYLAVVKRNVATRIGSDALAGDAVNSITCAYMAGTVLLGLIANAVFGWWWAESAAALLFLVWLVRETMEAFREAREHSNAEEPTDGE